MGANLALITLTDGSTCVVGRSVRVSGITFIPPWWLLRSVAVGSDHHTGCHTWPGLLHHGGEAPGVPDNPAGALQGDGVGGKAMVWGTRVRLMARQLRCGLAVAAQGLGRLVSEWRATAGSERVILEVAPLLPVGAEGALVFISHIRGSGGKRRELCRPTPD